MVSARLARLALALYPLAYRHRYGEEMGALLEDQGATPRAVADLLRGAARAHLRPQPGLARELDPDDRLKLGLSSTLLAWVVFSVAGLGFYKTTEDQSFGIAGDAHGLLGAAHLAVQILALIATAAVVLGAIQLVVAAGRQVPDRAPVRRAGVLACGCVAVFALVTAALVAVARSSAGGTLDAVILMTWTVLSLACGIGCAAACRLGLFAASVPRDVLRFATACAVVVAVAMVGVALATAVYLFALVHDASRLAGEGNGPLEILSVGTSIGIQLAVMVAVCAATAVSARRLRPRAAGS
jgi:hypothetical protein